MADVDGARFMDADEDLIINEVKRGPHPNLTQESTKKHQHADFEV